MSQVLIQQYLNQLQDLRKVSGTHRESVVREAFKDLLKAGGTVRLQKKMHNLFSNTQAHSNHKSSAAKATVRFSTGGTLD
jgi:hypothetical protein